jgi:hypothetical protein
MENRIKRKLGTEEFIFVDGEKKLIDIHAVANFEIMQIKRQFKKFTNINSKEPGIEIQEDQIILHVLKRAVGTQLSMEDLMQCENDLNVIYSKYFTNKVLTDEKIEQSAE